jgi:hypothetical protein
MTYLGQIRENDGMYEVLTWFDSDEEGWCPLASEYVRNRLLEGEAGHFFSVTIHEALLAEGWLDPIEARNVTERLSKLEAK